MIGRRLVDASGQAGVVAAAKLVELLTKTGSQQVFVHVEAILTNGMSEKKSINECENGDNNAR